MILVLFFVLRGGLLAKVEVVEIGSVEKVYPSQANSVLTASGYVVASRKAAVGSKGTGRLVYLGVEEGSLVHKGDIIGRLESADVSAALAQAEASLKASRATLQSAEAAFENADSNLRRSQSLFHQHILPLSELQSAQASQKQAQALVNADMADVELAERAVESAQVQVEFTNLRAPFDGTVLTKDADVGDVMTPFGSASGSKADIVTLADMSSLDAEVDVSETNIELVHVGQPCEISIDAIPNRRYSGHVHMIVPTADRAKGTVLTKVHFEDRDERVLPEMSLKVVFLKDSSVVDSTGPKVTVPASAVVDRGGKKVVFVVNADHVSETNVSLGQSVGGGLEVLSGLQVGDKVVLHPAETLKSGAAVKQSEE